jgi:hypothetical protein
LGKLEKMDIMICRRTQLIKPSKLDPYYIYPKGKKKAWYNQAFARE